MRGVYSSTKIASSGEPIKFPRGYLGYSSAIGSPTIGVTITHPLIQSESFSVSDSEATPGTRRVNLGDITATLYPIYSEAELDKRRKAIEPRPVDANRVERDTLPVFQDYRLRKILGKNLMYHFQNVKRTYKQAIDSNLIERVPSANKEEVFELIRKTHTTDEYRNYSFNTYNATLSLK